MQLEEDDIREFAQIWKEEFGEKLSAKEAHYHASRFIELFLLLAKPPRTRKGPGTDTLSTR